MTPAEVRIAALPWRDGLHLLPRLTAPAAEILNGSAAERVLDRFLRANRTFTALERQLSAEALFGVGLWRRRLWARTHPHAEPLDLLRAFIDDLGGLAPSPPPPDWRDRFSTPSWLAVELERAAGGDAAALAASLNLPGPITLRANRARIDRAALAARLHDDGVTTTPGALAPDALTITSPRPNLYALDAYRDGLFEVQDEGSQVLGEFVAARAWESVLDLCAGAGGKTLQLCATGATVHATDVDAARLERLRTRAERAHATPRIHFTAIPTDARFDAVLVDAPCSELGALRRGPDLRWRLNPDTFTQWPPVQRDLLATAARHLSTTGRIVYATCTFRSEENEAVVHHFTREHPEFTLAHTTRLLPHRDGTDGFFAAVLQRS